MKNKIFLFAAFVFLSIGAFASTKNTTTTTNNIRYNNDYGNSFNFVERGVTFSVFKNGEFDFYINPRTGLHVGYQGNGVNISYNSGYDYDSYVQYDDFGAIIQVEDIYIDYDYYGRVSRIGNTNINYNRGRLVSLGSLRVYYDNYGHYSHYSGYINSYNRSYVYHPYHNYFSRPLLDFRIVSYKPYRNHYKPTRYTYHRDHSKNSYYHKRNNNSYNKRNNTSTRQRIATSKVPKRNNYSTSRTNRSNANSTHKRSTNTPRTINNSRNTTNRSNTIINNRSNRIADNTRRNVEANKTNIGGIKNILDRTIKNEEIDCYIKNNHRRSVKLSIRYFLEEGKIL